MGVDYVAPLAATSITVSERRHRSRVGAVASVGPRGGLAVLVDASDPGRGRQRLRRADRLPRRRSQPVGAGDQDDRARGPPRRRRRAPGTDADRLAHAATHDLVTALPNRRLFLEPPAAGRRPAAPRCAPAGGALRRPRPVQAGQRPRRPRGRRRCAAHARRTPARGRAPDRRRRPLRWRRVRGAVRRDVGGRGDRRSPSGCSPPSASRSSSAGRRHLVSASIGIAAGRSGVNHDALIRARRRRHVPRQGAGLGRASSRSAPG